MAKAYSEEVKRRVIALHQEEGKTVAEIKDIVGISHVTIRNMLIEAGIDLPTKPRKNAAYYEDKAVVARYVALYKSGLSLKEIREQAPISEKTLRKLLRKEGVYDIQREKSDVSPEEFVRVVQTSDSFQEVCDRTGLSKQAVSSRYHLFKKNGVPLKKFARKSRVDYSALADLARALLPKEDK